ncbi:MAG: glycosyltransferase family 4 protein [candidate division Zixibacteria bacterium]|nr:glycosyltransferase family 4 protein [candidate division Zixibacteria bacterium]
MRLVIDARMYYASGIGTYLRNLIPIIVDQRPDIKFVIFGDKNKLQQTDWASKQNVKLIHCDVPIYSIKEQIKLPKIIPPCDLFFSPHYNVPMFYSGKMICTIHDIFHLSDENKQRTIPQYLYARLLLRSALKKSEIVMTDSAFSLNEMGKYGLPCLEKVRVVYLGFGRDKTNTEKQSCQDKKHILYVGNVKPHKNLKRLIDAFKLLHQQKKINIPLRIVGEEKKFITGMPELRKDITESSWSKWIKFTGWVDDDELKIQYENAAVLVLPSLYEGFGLPPLEAMACGCPCVVSKAASLPEICGNAAIYCDPLKTDDIANKISTVLENSNLQLELISNGYERVKLFNWEKTAKIFLFNVEKAVANNS